MRRTLAAVAAAAAALSLAGVAVAHHIGSSGTPADATFTTAKQRSETRVCTGTDGDTYQVSSGRYEGTAASANADLNGPIVISVKSVFNQTKNIGILEGWVKFQGASGERRAVVDLDGILGAGGAVNGFVSGRVLGNVTGTLAVDASFNGSLGKGENVASKAVVLSRVSCQRNQPARPAVKLTVKGHVDALTATQISVKPRDGSASQACAIAAGVSPSTSGFGVGTSVEMGCGLVSSQMTLLKLKRKDD